MATYEKKNPEEERSKSPDPSAHAKAEEAARRAGYFSAGANAYSAGNYAEAYRWFEAAAALGHSVALYNLGAMYSSGTGLAGRDPVRAFSCFQKAMEAGDQRSVLAVARAYFNGYGTSRDPRRALNMLQDASARNVPGAKDLLDQLAAAFRRNPVPPRNSEEIARDAMNAGDYAAAIRYYRIAAEQDHSADAANRLADLYAAGNGVPQDEAESFLWRLRSSELGDADAMSAAAESYFSGKNGAEKNDEKALFWAKKAKESGMLPDEKPVDELIRKIERNIAFNAARAAKEAGDFTEAVRQYQISAEKGSAAAAWNLAVMYDTGEGVPKEKAESFRWQQRSAELGHAEAMASMAASCFFGTDGAAADCDKALFWATKAKESGKLDSGNAAFIDELIRKIRQRTAAPPDLAEMYHRVQGVPAEAAERFLLRTTAADM